MIQSSRNHVFKYVNAFFIGDTEFASGLIRTKLIRMLAMNMPSDTYIKTLIVSILLSKMDRARTTGTRNALTQSQILMLTFHLV